MEELSAVKSEVSRLLKPNCLFFREKKKFELEMEKAKTKAKRKGGAEKLRARKKQALRADAAACVKITDMFSTGAGPSSAPVADIGGEEADERERDQRERGEGGELAGNSGLLGPEKNVYSQLFVVVLIDKISNE
ncbi:hypothetical protein F7725_021268 [Dissostichus mawsoni]|uniref:Uncharacterized protein n=1 Tax=Dissostichus mawsoni TaxID=36200 RepID=A0A7J5YFR5_DISMA|nr:hypothetical protein F7725_021268 [Dissostichus mawsoni]